jgi:hypothetical protein
MGGDYVAHIGSVGALRLAKAMWVLLATLEGWESGFVPTGTDSKSAVPEIQIVPNPANNTLNILLSGDEQFSQLDIYALNGTAIYSNKILPDARQFVIASDKWPEGNYILKLSSKQKTISKSFSLLHP